MLKWLWLSVLVIVLDQVTKIVAVNVLDPYQPIAVMPSFNLTLMFNTGAAFSFLDDAGGWQRWFFTVLALAVSVALVIWIKRMPAHEKWQAAALALILGGALGNVIDRIYLGHVVDFIQVYYADFYWPAFNIADSAIFVGAAILIVFSFRGEKKDAVEKPS